MSSIADTTCPFCGASFSPGASACPACDLPLLTERRSRTRALFDGADLFEDEPQLTERRRPRVGMLQAASPPPDYSRGALRCVVVALNQAEADMLEDMLRSEGIPCVVRRVGRADVPEFLAAGRREVMVPEGALEAARDLLRIDPPTETLEPTSPVALGMALLAGLALVILCVSVIVALT